MRKGRGEVHADAEQETVQLAGAVSKGQARDDHLPGPRTRSNAQQTGVTNLRPGGRSLSLKITSRLCSSCKEERMPYTTQPGHPCVSRLGGRGPVFYRWRHARLHVSPLPGGNKGGLPSCSLSPGYRKTLPGPPFEGGDLVSIVGDTPALASPPSQGGIRGVFPLLLAVSGLPQDPPWPSLRGRGLGFCRLATPQPSRLPPPRGEQGGSSP